MDSIIINKSISYKTSPVINEYKNSISASKDNKHTNKNSNNTIFKNNDNSDISNDAVIGYKFLNRIETSMHDINKIPSIDKYTSEYKKIKKEIASGLYGNDKNKYIDLLDDAFKNSLNNTSDFFVKSSTKTNNIKMSSSSLTKCQKQYETATSLVWIFSAENKRILQEIEDYKKKKNHRMVTSLTQLNSTYKHVINNISAVVTLMQSTINDSFGENPNESTESTESAAPEPLNQFQNQSN